MKVTDKKRKTVTFDARDALERTSENMEWMTALMDKMYIKLDQKKYPISPRFIKEEVEDRIGKILDKVIIGEEIDLSVENVIKIIEDMEEVGVNFRRGNFQGRFSNNFGRNDSRDRKDRRIWR